jgi:hypothetical protein
MTMVSEATTRTEALILLSPKPGTKFFFCYNLFILDVGGTQKNHSEKDPNIELASQFSPWPGS